MIFLNVYWPLQENSTGEDVFTHDKPAASAASAPPDSSTMFGQLNLPSDVANVLQSFQQGGNLPQNLDPVSAQNILASMMVRVSAVCR